MRNRNWGPKNPHTRGSAETPSPIARYRVTVTPLEGPTGSGTFRDVIAAMAYVRRYDTRLGKTIAGYRLEDMHTGEIVREGIA